MPLSDEQQVRLDITLRLLGRPEPPISELPEAIRSLAALVLGNKVECTCGPGNQSGPDLPPSPYDPPGPDLPPGPLVEGGTAVNTGPVVELDKVNKIPWDDRIHAGTKTKTKDGAWKLKKGVDKTLVEQVIAELKAKWGNQPDPTGGQNPGPPSGSSGNPENHTGTFTDPSVKEKKDVMWLLQKATEKGLTAVTLNPFLNQCGLGSITDLESHPEKIPLLAMLIGVE